MHDAQRSIAVPVELGNCRVWPLAVSEVMSLKQNNCLLL